MKFFNKTSFGFILRFSLLVFISLGVAIVVSLYESKANTSAVDNSTLSQQTQQNK